MNTVSAMALTVGTLAFIAGMVRVWVKASQISREEKKDDFETKKAKQFPASM